MKEQLNQEIENYEKLYWQPVFKKLKKQICPVENKN